MVSIFSCLLAGDPKRCARVNSALDWYHGNMRLPAIMLTWYVVGKTMSPSFRPIQINERSAQRQLAVLRETLKVGVLTFARVMLMSRPFSIQHAVCL